MSIVITILLVLASIITLFILVALLTKKDFNLQKFVVVNKPKDEVFNYLKLIKNQEQYSVWVMRDPNVQLTYTGVDGSIGFIAAWQSNIKNVGIGEQEIKHITPGQSMDVEIRFKKPFSGTNFANTSVTELSNHQTKVTNTFTGKSKFPMNIMNLFMDKLVGTDMQQNLNNMKTNLEKI